MRTYQLRGGFTMIQLLLLLGLLAFGLALALPFIARLREAAAQAESQNNMKQIVLAMHGYLDAYKLFPPAVGANAQAEGTAFFHILPFVEQADLFQRAGGKAWNNGAYSVPLPVYLNSRDKSAPAGNLFKGWLATSNYAVNWPLLTDKGAGVNDLPDGFSNTIGAVERYQVCNGHPNGWGYSSIYYWAPIFGYYSKARFQVAPEQGRCNPALPQGIDPRGINVALCDGSVRTASDGCSPETWWYAVDPRDNMALGADFE